MTQAESKPIKYTLDGSTPNSGSSTYAGPITIDSPTEIKAVGYDSGTGTYSPVSTGFFDVSPNNKPLDVSASPTVRYMVLHLRSDFGPVTNGMGSPPPLTSWYDLSDSGATGTPASGAKPTITGPPSTPLVHLDGSSDAITLPSGFTSWGGMTMFGVVRPTSTTGQILDLGNGSSGNSLGMRIRSLDGKGEAVMSVSTTEYSAATPASLSAGMLNLVDAVQIPGGSGNLYSLLNGVAGTAQTTGGNNIPNVTRSSNFVGRKGSGGNFLPGDIAEVIVYNIDMTNLGGPYLYNQRPHIDAFLAHKYQLFSQSPVAPQISIPTATLLQPTNVYIAAPEGAITRFTTDGTDPTAASQPYNGQPIRINYTQTIKARSFAHALQSAVTSATYTLDSTLWPAPSPSDVSPV